MNVVCPECHIPMILNDDKTEVECQMCHSTLLVWLDDEPKEPSISKEKITLAFKEASNILSSSMEKKAQLSATLGGNWGKVYFALLKIAETGFNVSEKKLTGFILRAGISGMMTKYVELLQMTLQSEQMVKEGALRQETVNSLLADMTNFNPDIDLEGFLKNNDMEEKS